MTLRIPSSARLRLIHEYIRAYKISSMRLMNTKKFMGVIGSDLTVTSDTDLEWQEAIMLVNQLYMAVLAVNNVKVVQNI